MAAKKKPSSKPKQRSAKRPVKKRASKKPAPARKATAKKAAAKRPRKEPETAGDRRVAEIQRIIDVMVTAGAVEVEMEEKGSKLRVRLKEEQPVPVVSYAAPTSAPAPAALPHAAAAVTEEPAVEDDPTRKLFRSPMVGTFYRAASPDADPFVNVGDSVEDESTICILEAMKVMNEIKAECSGEVAEILAQNGEPVEFGQPLFVIKVA